MNRCHVTFFPSNRRALVDEGTTLLDAIRAAEIPFDAACGGSGSCGKCMVNVLSGGEIGLQKACKTIVASDMEVSLLSPPEAHISMLQGGEEVPPVFAPPVELLGFVPDLPFLMAAFDIGTTSVVCYILDGETGHELAVASCLNPQSVFGADVISRAAAAVRYTSATLKKEIQYAMNRLLAAACEKAGKSPKDVMLSAVSANTCMQHLFLGLPTDSLMTAPYLTASLEGRILDAAVSGLSVDPRGKVLVLPNIASFIGGDTVAGLLSTEMLAPMDPTLFIDIGTNGEIVLATKNRRIACSAAAGPAFEGAKIRCGMCAGAGAIDHVVFDNGRLLCSTIENAPPIGVCGSGLVDTAAGLLSIGMLDPSGRMMRLDELLSPVAVANVSRVTTIDGKPAFCLAKKTVSGNGAPVVVTQRDIRELQLAKAAIATAVDLLTEEMGITVHQIWHVFIAGAFGNYLTPASACAIGLLPKELQSRIKIVGNTAGFGAKLLLSDRTAWERAEQIAASTEYLALATHAGFQDRFVSQLPFPRSTGSTNIFGKSIMP